MARRVAVLALAAALAAGPARADVWSRAGAGAALLGRWDEALVLLSSAPGEPGPAARYFRALALSRTGRGPSARALWQALSEAGGPFSGPALERVVERLFRRGRHGEVVRCFEASRAERFTDPDALWYRVGESYALLGRQERAEALLSRVAPSSPFGPYAAHARALLAFRAGRVADALRLLEQGIGAALAARGDEVMGALADRLRITRGQILYQAAVGLRGLGQGERRQLLSVAEAQFGKVDGASPFRPEALEGIGWCARERGDTARALAAFSLALDLSPARAHELAWAQARVYEDAGIPAEAARLYARARELALARAEDLEQGRAAPPAPGGEAAALAAVARGVEGVARRLDGVAASAEAAAGALGARQARIEALRERLGARAARLGEIREALRKMASGLREHLDRVPAEALFPRGERPRILALLTAQARLESEAERLGSTLSALRAFEGWAAAPAGVRRRGEVLERRLQEVRAGLIRARVAFLEAVKQRVTVRERELAARIREVEELGTALGGPVEAAGRALDREQERLEAARGRLERIRVRLRSLGEDLEGLRRAAALREEELLRARAASGARELRLLADRYALDETQALHLLKERSPAGEEGRP